AQYEARTSDISTGKGAFPAGAQLCTKCHTKAVVLMDGCMTCLNCGDSKCG
ncbi:MAG TPA: NrdJb, partial [Thermodesulfobacteriota bacterium]|nr:NrdJb [Thermodesulfobacteriota bacterium]